MECLRKVVVDSMGLDFLCQKRSTAKFVKVLWIDPKHKARIVKLKKPLYVDTKLKVRVVFIDLRNKPRKKVFVENFYKASILGTLWCAKGTGYSCTMTLDGGAHLEIRRLIKK